MDRSREREAIADDIDGAITVGVFLASILGGLGAFALYQNGHIVWAWILGAVSLIGANVGTVGYSRWRKRRARKTAAAKQPSGRISRLISFLVMTFVLLLALYFMVRGAWWISVILLILEIAFEGGYMQKKRRAASMEKNDAAI